ncbi:hypothetical protein [Kribbella sp. VKM Ac-2568]|uniref:hypothetical protein n=1 Tax=Kribbella sp. VKM Ac-2568 TaxID=2512219 RepID=UPI001044B780|nr:hypothetical protein [Kribbella sp. VKM Ac-2568]TCM51475.1 hypothetical protein EV648_101312 [Kribbella sp. VKM Ac-2568]
MKLFSEEEPAERRRFRRKREGLRRIAVLVVAPAGVYAVLVSVSLLGGPRLGAPLIPLPGAGGVDATSPIAGPQPSRLPAKNFPPIPPEVSNPTVPPAVLPTVAPSTTGQSTGDRSTTGRSADDPSTSGRWNERSVADSRGRVPGATDLPAEPQVPGRSTTNPAEHPDPSIPPTTKTPPPTTDPPPPPDTPSNPPDNPDEPDQPSLTDALLGLLDKIL